MAGLPWHDFFNSDDRPPKFVEHSLPRTGVTPEKLTHIGNKFSSMSERFNVHTALRHVLNGCREMLQSRVADWAMGEAYAFESLLEEKYHVRLSRQDVERGTFAHRHHVVHDQIVDQKAYNSFLTIKLSIQFATVL